MKHLARYVVLAGLAAVLCSGPGLVIAQTSTISALGTGNALGGTEAMPMDQTGCTAGSQAPTCKTTPAAILTYVEANGAFSGSQISSGTLPLTALTTAANATVVCNNSGSSATPIACNPLSIANMMGAKLAVDAAAVNNITLSGAQTVDGVSVGSGQTVLVAGQTTSSQNGIYVSASGAWTRAPNFPANYVVAQNCDVAVYIRQGSALQGYTYFLQTTSSVTIGASAQTWASSFPRPNSTTPGWVAVTQSPAVSPYLTVSYVGGLLPATLGDCASITDSNGSMGDNGNGGATAGGPCAVTDPNGHIIAQGNGTGPTVTGSGCSAGAGSFDASGSVVTTGADACTITFGSAYTTAPHCSLGPHSSTVQPFISIAETTAHFGITTAAAGTVSYVCQ